jgi:hypothetical protein
MYEQIKDILPIRLDGWIEKHSRQHRAVDIYLRDTKTARCKYEMGPSVSIGKTKSFGHTRRHRQIEFSRWAAKPKTDALLARNLALARPYASRFRELASRWRNDVRSVSSTTDRVLHSAYQDIIGMGERVLPLIFRELEQHGGHWFWALRHITHQNPVSSDDAGNVHKMSEAWLEWGREHHYL